MNDFRRDDEWQKAVRDSVLAPGFYRRFSTDGRYVFLDKGELATLLQKRCAVDTIAQGKGGAAVCIEEKIVRWPGYEYTCYTLETDSCTKPGYESLGWMHYGRADYLLYCFARPDLLVCHLIEFPALKAWFWERDETFDTFGPLNTLNRTKGRKVPLKAVAAAMPVRVFDVHPNPDDPVAAALFPEVRRKAA